MEGRHMTRDHRMGRKPSWLRRINWSAVVGVLLIVAAAYTAGTTYQLGQESSRRAECQTQLNRAFLDSLQARDGAARESSEAQRLLISTPSDSTEQEKIDARRRHI